MLHAIKHCQDIPLWKSTRIEPPFLHFDGPNSCNDCVFMDQKYNDQLYFLNQVDSTINLLNDVLIKRVVVQPTTKPRNVGPHKSKLNTTTNSNKITPQKQEIQE